MRDSMTDTTGSIVTWQAPDEMVQGWPVLRQMYPRMTEREYQQRLQALQGYDYRQFAYVNGIRCLGVVGVWCIPRIWCGLQLDIDNFVVDRDVRSSGIGKRLLDHCLAYGLSRGADVAALDTFVDNPSSHRFYFREGFTIRGYHFVKPLQGQSIWTLN
jgi:GNAT superfamily N-acetyltransferase